MNFLKSIVALTMLNKAYSILPKIIQPVRKAIFSTEARVSRIRSVNGLRVVTDIDDTVKSSGGVKLLGIPLGGIDTHYKRGEFYPGAFQFAFELSSSNLLRGIPSRIAVLTARAREFKFALALKPGDKLCSKYENTGKNNGVSDWGVGDVYYGSVAEWIFQNRKGIRKFSNFELLLTDDKNKGRNDDYILIGDTGEKDEDASERIALQYSDKIRAVFLHTVSDRPDRSQLRIPDDRTYNGVPFFYFRTYVGAAGKAYQAGLLGGKSLLRIIDQARLDLSSKEPIPSKLTPTERMQVSTRWKELEEDILIAKKIKSSNSKFQNIFEMFELIPK